MPSQIENELRNRCTNTENFRLLLAQWEYDRLLLGQALTAVGHAFPHYSLHDATHSETILERIAAMLGSPALSQLSATDLWLLLEAAYLHDSGMVVLEATRRKDLASAEFESFLKATAEGKDRELAARANRLLDRHITQDGLLGMLEGHLDLLLVYAEFVRKQHPRRAEAVALSPLETTRIASPRTLLLPNRFWYLIGRICRAHGESFDFVLHELPFEESGVGGELCHPRFVACMLRLGDLLDLDSGRFCPTINATIPQLPHLSEAHRSKHAGIRHLLVCPSRIEVSGVYTELDAYLEAERWFTWLREELSAQLVRWTEIAPSHFGTLPSAGRIEARIEGQITLEPAARPRFEVDREKMIELVQGANIYRGAEDAAREIIQNAVDATLLRYSYESQSRGASPPKDLAELRANLQGYWISVTLERVPPIARDPAKVEWILSIKDQGIGIRVEDAKFMLTLGSSKRNTFKQAVKEWLPEWARPSGTFGIGFHSLFLYCHQVRVVSRHPDDSEGLEIVFTAQPETTEPTVIIRKRDRPGKEVTFAPEIGTLVEARISVERFPDLRSHYRTNRRLAALNRYDLVLDQEIPITPIAISELIEEMTAGSLCSFVSSLQPSLPGSARGLSDEATLFYYFSTEDCIEVRVTGFNLLPVGIRPKYRGAAIEAYLEFPPFEGACDLHASDAALMLELSRNNFTAAGWRTVAERLRRALYKAVPMWLEQLRSSANRDNVEFLSLYALLNDINGCGDEWKSVTLGGSLELGVVASADMVIIEHYSSGSPKIAAKRGQNKNLIIIKSVGHSWLFSFIRRFFGSLSLEAVGDSYRSFEHFRQYRVTKSVASEDVSDAALSSLLGSSSFEGGRSAIPCPRRFIGLSLDLSTYQNLPGGPFAPDPLMQAALVSPFVSRKTGLESHKFLIELPRIEDYVRWLSRVRSESESSIAEKLIDFIQYVDQLMHEKWREIKGYDINLVVRDLSRMIQQPRAT